MSTNKTHARRRTAREWARLVAAWQKSGKGAAEFASSRGIAPSTLTWWRWRLASALPSPEPIRLVPLQLEPSPPAAPTSPPDATPAWEIVTARGHVLRVHRGIAAAELAAVLEALELVQARR